MAGVLVVAGVLAVSGVLVVTRAACGRRRCGRARLGRGRRLVVIVVVVVVSAHRPVPSRRDRNRAGKVVHLAAGDLKRS
jgi:hypothetical protein